MTESLPHIPVLGCLPRLKALGLPSRHLGLVQALEHPDLQNFLDTAADAVKAHLDIDALCALARPPRLAAAENDNDGDHVRSAAHHSVMPPLGARIAVARDAAFAFAYPALLDDWVARGVMVLPFSPLADEAPDSMADAVYLPGGYPELHAGRLASNTRFLNGLRKAGGRGATVFGECGGYMVLGDTLTDAAGTHHRMAGLLPLRTSFATRGLHLGYRVATLEADGPLGQRGRSFRGHEFHYATVMAEDSTGADPLFTTRDAMGALRGSRGLRRGGIMGSFIHLIGAETVT